MSDSFKIRDLLENKPRLFYPECLNMGHEKALKEFVSIYSVLSNLKYIELRVSHKDEPNENEYALTYDGLRKINELQNKTNYSKKIFIAMSFDKSVEYIEFAFKEAILNAGFQPMIIKDKEHNNYIMPEIFYEIENSSAVVMDLTSQNYGAYYEAGYALGLNKKVIACCKEDVFKDPTKKPHFDILHIDLDLVTAQQVFNAHLRQTGRTDLAVTDLFGFGQHQQADLGFLTITDQTLLLGFHILAVLEKQGIGLGMAQQFPEIPLILYGIKFQAADTLGIPAAETDITKQQIIAHQRRERGRSHRLFLGIDIDQQTATGIHTLGLKRVLIKQQQQHTHQNQQGKGEKKIQQSIEHPKRSRQFIDKDKTDQSCRCQCGKQAGEHDAQGFRQRRVADNAFISAEQ